MSRIAWTLAALLLASPAWAEPDNEVVVQAGLVTVGADAFDTFAANNDIMPTFGVRAGLGVTDRLDLIAGVRSGQRGQRVYDFEARQELFRSAYTASTLTLGAKVDADVDEQFRPYFLGGLVGHVGHVRADDDPTRRDHPGQVRSTALSAGATAAAGMEFRFRDADKDLIPVLQLELGWQGVLNHRHRDDAFPLGYSGVAFRSGLGMAF